jgi:hypothetical protein
MEITSLKISVFHIRGNSLFISALSRERVYNCRLGNDVFTSPCSRNMTTEPLRSNGRLAPTPILWLLGCASQYCHVTE